MCVGMRRAYVASVRAIIRDFLQNIYPIGLWDDLLWYFFKCDSDTRSRNNNIYVQKCQPCGSILHVSFLFLISFIWRTHLFADDASLRRRIPTSRRHEIIKSYIGYRFAVIETECVKCLLDVSDALAFAAGRSIFFFRQWNYIVNSFVCLKPIKGDVATIISNPYHGIVGCC